MRRMRKGLLLAVMMLVAATSQAGWSLDPAASYLSFVTTKNADVAEAHAFVGLHGTVSDAGAVNVAVDLDTVQTLVAVRDERMRDILFEVQKFPLAVFTAQLDLSQLRSLAPGQTRSDDVVGQLALHDHTSTVRADVAVTRVDEKRFIVVTKKPIVVLADSYGLAPGVEQLRQIAGLKEISMAVPVSLSLQFVQDM